MNFGGKEGEEGINRRIVGRNGMNWSKKKREEVAKISHFRVARDGKGKGGKGWERGKREKRGEEIHWNAQGHSNMEVTRSET